MDLQSANRSVLIIDDNKDMREIYSTFFEQAGFKVHTSNDGLAGITAVVDTHPTVIIVDALMPEMNGFDFLANLKNNTSVKTPVIVVTSLANEEDKQKALEAGADLYLVKTDYAGEKLVDEVNRFLLSWQAVPNDDNK